ncbi:hypothetical protein BAnh1_08960 [Bartonella australis AUST/NH1]|uniref:N-terminal double-transmembrane domain-containing protein n=1 Tax=Bartonella australis (strain Aust/NH1) TaxID=1094489 RepID=M1P4I8_BARAA|nr:DUF4159 domain-containing protein [Bartonella australis]AGF74770.1 hypothetical protein BAnh1_08960 [Bartonella australis AUST/NH1]
MSFGSPLLLLGLFALPLLWWLLKKTPPPPHKELFPPLRLLLKQAGQQTMADRTSWWMLLLRLTIAASVIIALARPNWNEKPVMFSGSQQFALIIDNGWASAEAWQKRIAVAQSLLTQAEKNKKSVYLLATAEDNTQIDLLSAKETIQHLRHLQSRPWPTNRVDALKKLIEKIGKETLDIVYLSDGLQTSEDNQAFALIEQLKPQTLLWYSTDISNLVGITTIENDNGSMAARVIRATARGKTAVTLNLYNAKNQLLGRFSASFREGETATLVPFNLPLELRNDIAWIKINDHPQAAATFLVDKHNQINRVALLSPSINKMVQPLLSPFYYVIKALQGHAQLITAEGGELSGDISNLLEQNPSVFIMGDIVNISKEAEKKLSDFVNKGGVLIRFAGENLSTAQHYDSLLPVPLRHGKRLLGSVMSWAKPQKLASFTESKLFFDLPFPEDVTVSRQILAEPNSDLFEKTWLSLADGTPLITAATRGKGTLVFVHIAPDPTWSNLPLSGFFTQMLQKLIALSAHENETSMQIKAATIQPPWKILTADGQLQTPPSHVAPLVIDAQKPPLPSYRTPPGLYGFKDNLHAFNLLNHSSRLVKQSPLPPYLNEVTLSYDIKEKDLTGLFFGLASLLLALDSFLVLWAGRAFFLNRKSSILLLLFCVASFDISPPNISVVHAQSSEKYNEITVQAAGSTHLAYVATNNYEIDATSKSGLETLSRFIAERTMLSPGSVVALDLDKDELAFYPLIYWPIDANSPMPTRKSLEKISAFMKHGGTILFDTRDQISANLDLEGTATPASQRLRAILNELNIPSLEPASSDHVVARSFYIMPDFPGRYRGSLLWVEASSVNKESKNSIAAGDNVSSLLITANNFADAWALDEKGTWKYPLVPNDPMQRLWAFRAGLNIVIYTLTGNYKADQVHVPALLERFNRERRR